MDYEGKYVLIRSGQSGVHCGVFRGFHNGGVVLDDSRRLWSWRAKDGVALSGVSQSGLAKADTKVDVVVPSMWVGDVCEVIPCSAAAEKSVREFK